MKERRRVKFANQHSPQTEFYKTLQFRVRNFLKQRPGAGKANGLARLKIILFPGAYITLYALIISGMFAPAAAFWLVLLFGATAALTGFNIAHDAVHGALFRQRRWNKLLSYCFEITGISSYAWYLKHNLVHHNNPNVSQADYDIEAAPVRWCFITI
jgi:linoleoyl-CoA desaturase